jgi:hypothetical protein
MPVFKMALGLQKKLFFSKCLIPLKLLHSNLFKWLSTSNGLFLQPKKGISP